MRLLLIPVLLMLSILTGCSGLVAHKVPLEDRLHGTDGRYKGFRYYLSRPYLVVAERLEIGARYERTDLGYLRMPGGRPLLDHKGEKVFVLRGLTGAGPVLYDLAGKPVDPAWKQLEFVGVSFEQTKQMKKAGTGLSPLVGGPSSEERLHPQDPRLKLGSGGTGAVRVSGKENDPPDCDVSSLQVIFLPDFEQQMTVKSENILAKNKYSMEFLDGWQLASVDAHHDSTAIPVAILNTIQNAIGAAADVESNRQKLLRESDPSGFEKSKQALQPQKVLITRSLYIEPGMYRLQKPSERSGECVGGIGILEDLGVNVLETTEVQILGAP